MQKASTHRIIQLGFFLFIHRFTHSHSHSFTYSITALYVFLFSTIHLSSLSFGCSLQGILINHLPLGLSFYGNVLTSVFFSYPDMSSQQILNVSLKFFIIGFQMLTVLQNCGCPAGGTPLVACEKHGQIFKQLISSKWKTQPSSMWIE